MNRYFKRLEKIEFVVTNACTGRCKHCSQGDHTADGPHLDGETAARAVKSLAQQYSIKTVMTFGGEPLLYPQTVYAVMRAARDAGVPIRQVITNGYFTAHEEHMQTVARCLQQSGVNDLLVSADAFHQESIPLQTVLRFAVLAKKEGVPVRVQPAWLVQRGHDNAYNAKTEEILQAFAQMGIEENSGNIVFSAGNALKYLGQYLQNTTAQDPYLEDPADIRCVSVCPNGDVLNGNIYTQSITDIMAQYKPGFDA